MKKVLLVLFASLLTAISQAQSGGQVALSENSTNSRVSNALTGMLVRTNDFINVLLYAAPDGTTSEDAFVSILPGAPVGNVSPGHYNGGTRTIMWAQPGMPVMIQVRAFETTYGTNYEQALAAPPMNGRPALVGRSAIGRVILGGNPPGGPPISPPLAGSIVGPITVAVATGAYLSVNDLAIAEGSNGVVQANFRISLSGAQAGTISVDFATQDGTALAAQDYVSTNGTVTFAPGETVKIVPVLVTADEAPEADENFFLTLSNPINGFIARRTGSCLITEVRITGISLDTSVSFNTVANKHYAVEKTTDSVTWNVVPGATNLLGNGNIVSIIDRGTGCQGMSIYRARLLEQ